MKKTSHVGHTRSFILKSHVVSKINTARIKAKSSDDETYKMIHQLEVHQIELEMMNEELKRARLTAQQTAEKYSELFDLAPSGYFVLSKESEIFELNLAGAQLLGNDQIQLRNQRFDIFISEDCFVDAPSVNCKDFSSFSFALLVVFSANNIICKSAFLHSIMF